MDKKELEKSIVECATDKRYKGDIIVTIPSGMTKLDAEYLCRCIRGYLLAEGEPQVVTIHEGKYMTFGLKQKLENNEEYRKKFIENSLRDMNLISKIRIIN